MKKTPLYNYIICCVFAIVSVSSLIRWYQEKSQLLLIFGIVCAVLFVVLLDLIIRGGIKFDPVILKSNEKIIKDYRGVSVKKTSALSWAVLWDMGITITNKRVYLNQGRRISSLSLVYNKSDLPLFSKLNSALITDVRFINEEVCIKMRGGWFPLNLTWKIKEDADFIYRTIKECQKPL